LSSSLTINKTSRLRTPRGIAVVFLMLTYIFGGLVHGLTDAGAFNLPVSAEISTSVDSSDGHSDKGTVADHHCHGCFSVSKSTPPQVLATVELGIAPLALLQAGRWDRVPELDTPPPRLLI